MKPDQLTLDIQRSVELGHHTLRSIVVFCRGLGWALTDRVVDRRLQKLRKSGLITYDREARHWSLKP